MYLTSNRIPLRILTPCMRIAARVLLRPELSLMQIYQAIRILLHQCKKPATRSLQNPLTLDFSFLPLLDAKPQQARLQARKDASWRRYGRWEIVRFSQLSRSQVLLCGIVLAVRSHSPSRYPLYERSKSTGGICDYFSGGCS